MSDEDKSLAVGVSSFMQTTFGKYKTFYNNDYIAIVAIALLNTNVLYYDCIAVVFIVWTSIYRFNKTHANCMFQVG